jgi:hypothetical protein
MSDVMPGGEGVPPRWRAAGVVGVSLAAAAAGYSPLAQRWPLWAVAALIAAFAYLIILVFRSAVLPYLGRWFADCGSRERVGWLGGAGLVALVLWLSIPVPAPCVPNWSGGGAARASAAGAAANAPRPARVKPLPVWAQAAWQTAVRAGALVSLAFGVLLAGVWLSRASLRGSGRSGWLGYAACCAGVWAFYLLLFWPGLMNADSFDQWGQIESWDWVDHHPVFHSFCNWLVTRVWHYPAMLAIAQIVALSAVVGWALSLMRSWGMPRWLAWTACAVVALAPANGVMAITVCKDTPFAIALLVLTVLVLKAVASGGAWLRSPWAWLALGGTAALVSLFRQNGPAAAFGTLVALLACYRASWRRVGGALVLAAALVAVVRGPFFRWLDVRPSIQMPGLNFVALHHVAAHLHAGTEFTEEEKALLARLRNPADGWPYLPHNADVLFYDGKFSFIEGQKLSAELPRLALDLARRAPGVSVRHFVDSNTYLWRVAPRPGEVLWSICVGVHGDGRVWTMDARGDASAFPPLSWLPGLQKPAALALQHSYSKPIWCALLWRPALYLHLGLLAALVAVLRARSWAWLLPLAPALLNTASIAVFACGQIHRYGYPLQLVTLTTAAFLLLGVPLARRHAARMAGADDPPLRRAA